MKGIHPWSLFILKFQSNFPDAMATRSWSSACVKRRHIVLGCRTVGRLGGKATAGKVDQFAVRPASAQPLLRTLQAGVAALEFDFRSRLDLHLARGGHSPRFASHLSEPLNDW